MNTTGNPINVAVACRNASGMADLPVFSVQATAHEIVMGTHYDTAAALAREAGYEPPFLCFDPDEHRAIGAAARALSLVPQVVAIDLTDGLIHSVCCDAGTLKVICYDESDIDEASEAVADRPVGENGALVRCWAHIQVANVDPGLKNARD